MGWRAGDPQQLVVGRREDGVRMAGSGPDRVVARQADVDEGADRLQVADRRDPADDEPGRLTDHLGAGQLHGVQLEQVGDLRRVDPVGPRGEDEQRLGRRAGAGRLGSRGEDERVRDLGGDDAEVCGGLGGRARGTVQDDHLGGDAEARQCLADAGDGGVGEDRGTGLLGRPRRRGGHRRRVTRARHARTVMAVLASTGVFPSRRSGAYPA